VPRSPKTVQFAFGMTPEQRDKLHALADAERRTVADLLRIWIEDNYAEKLGDKATKHAKK
jgi:predicted DNA-binding protein